jgi:hypothetical protein
MAVAAYRILVSLSSQAETRSIQLQIFMGHGSGWLQNSLKTNAKRIARQTCTHSDVLFTRFVHRRVLPPHADVMLQIFTGSPPFSNLKYMAPSAILVGKRPNRPSSPVIPNIVWKVIKRCWAQDKDSRPNMDCVWYSLKKTPPADSVPVQGSVKTHLESACVSRISKGNNLIPRIA